MSDGDRAELGAASCGPATGNLPPCQPRPEGEFKDPILLFGLPRSGTSWVGKILDSHPLTLFRHEPDSELKLADLPLLPATADSERLHGEIGDYTQRLLSIRSEKVNGSFPYFRKDYYSEPVFMTRMLLSMVSKAGGRMGWRLDIPDLIARAERRRVRVVWKSIESTGRLGLFARGLEGCRVVHLLRHPCGQIASTLRGIETRKFTSGTPLYDDEDLFRQLTACGPAARRGLTFEDVWRLSAAEKLAWYWVLLNEKALDDCAGLTNVMPLVYEDLCQDPVEVSRRMFQHVGLDWSLQSEAFLKESTSGNKAGYYSLYKDPLKSANRWRAQMSGEDVARIAGIVRSSPLWAFYGESFGCAPAAV